MPRDEVLRRAAYPSDQGREAKEAFDVVRTKSFMLTYGDRGVQLDNGEFAALVQFLHDRCNWERFELELRVKHFEGWEQIDWND